MWRVFLAEDEAVSCFIDVRKEMKRAFVDSHESRTAEEDYVSYGGVNFSCAISLPVIAGIKSPLSFKYEDTEEILVLEVV